MTSKPIPMFPLPDFFLFPGALTPLHIFEDRYRQMIDDLMDRAGRLVMASIPRRYAGRGLEAPPVLPTGGLGEIVQHERLDDGRFVVLLLGLSRVILREVPSKRLYRMAEVEPLRIIESTRAEAEDLRPALTEAIEARAGQKLETARELPIGTLADLLAQALKLSPEQLSLTFAEPRATRRAEQVLTWHDRNP